MKVNRHHGATPGEYFWQIRVRTNAHLDFWLKDYLDGIEMNHQSDGTSLLTGDLPDMPAVYGLILQLRDAGVSLISLNVERISRKEND